MRSDKVSKKTRTNVEEPLPSAGVEASSANEKTAKPRSSSKSSKSKGEPVETSSSAMRHRKAATVNLPEPVIEKPVSKPKAMAAVAAGGSAVSAIVDPVGVEVATVMAAEPHITRERIQELAYQYWIADGRPHGNHHEHWLRAESALLGFER